MGLSLAQTDLKPWEPQLYKTTWSVAYMADFRHFFPTTSQGLFKNPQAFVFIRITQNVSHKMQNNALEQMSLK